MTPIERAARALCHGDPDEIIQPAYQASPKSDGPRPLWHTYVPAVRAVITAIREPSADMKYMGGLNHPPANVGPIWQAMIDALLAEGK